MPARSPNFPLSFPPRPAHNPRLHITPSFHSSFPRIAPNLQSPSRILRPTHHLDHVDHLAIASQEIPQSLTQTPLGHLALTPRKIQPLTTQNSRRAHGPLRQPLPIQNPKSPHLKFTKPYSLGAPHAFDAYTVLRWTSMAAGLGSALWHPTLPSPAA